MAEGWLGLTPHPRGFATCACWRGSCCLPQVGPTGGRLAYAPPPVSVGSRGSSLQQASAGWWGLAPALCTSAGLGLPLAGVFVFGREGGGFYPGCVPLGALGLSLGGASGGGLCPRLPAGNRAPGVGALPSTAPAPPRPAPAAPFPSGFDPSSEQKGRYGVEARGRLGSGRRSARGPPAPPPRVPPAGAPPASGRWRHLAAPAGEAGGSARPQPGPGRRGCAVRQVF